MKLKKLLCAVLIMAMFCSMAAPLFVFATEKTDAYALLYSEDGRIIKVPDEDVSKYTAVGWKTTHKEFKITDKSENHKFGNGVLQIFNPEKLSGATYRDNKEVKTVYITGNVTDIYPRILTGCSNLSRIEISDTVTQIHNDAFEGEFKINRVGIPKSVTYIHADAFGDWHTPKSFVIYCEKDSKAEEFAKKFNIKYVYATMIYCVDGRTMMVDDKEKIAYLESGLWNTTPLIKLYATDGREKLVARDEVEANVKVGWFKNRSDVVVTMYAADGRTKEVFKGNVAAEKKAGWYEKKSDVLVTVYALDGRSKEVYKANVEAEKKVGWYDSPIITVYALDGRTTKIPSSKKDAYLKVGWYDSPIITMYAADGRTTKIPSSKKEAYKKVGWYDGPVITIYAADGRTKKISTNDKAAYLKVGWYDVPVVRIGTMDGRSKVIPSSKLEAYKKVGWYHIPNANLKVAKEITLPYNVFLYTHKYSYSNTSDVSQVQQFKYKNEGVAVAYIEKNKLIIELPSKRLSLDIRHPLLGDVIADDDGNIYIVWGGTNADKGNYNAPTVYISKYTPDGKHVKSTGFVGESNGGSWTAVPFHGGTCHSVIGNGVLMVNYARLMYNKHQSSNGIGVNISDMSPYKFKDVWSIPYISHSFNQRVIFSKNTNNFVFMDHGDGQQTRGFVMTHINYARYNIFHFYLQANSNYDMTIVNNTFAQMGSFFEIDKNLYLVGASVKSISADAEKENQNLFIQIINPTKATKIDEKLFVGGTTRSGAMSFDVWDNQNKPLTPVTDYGVRWLTNYTDGYVLKPQAVAAGDKIVILWDKKLHKPEKYTDTEAFYMVLQKDGKVVVPPTSLGKNLMRNSDEDPIYHNGKVYWASVHFMKLSIMSIDVPK